MAYYTANTIVDNFFCRISRKYRDAKEAKRREEKRLKEEASRKEWEKTVEHARQENRLMMDDIMKENPSGKLLWIKFQGGTTGTGDQFRESLKEQKEYIRKHDAPWCYTRGTGLVCINPDKFGNSPESIAKILWEPSRFLEGQTISKWWFEEN